MNLPASPQAFDGATWEQIAPYYEALQTRPLTAETVDTWLRDWSRLNDLLSEYKSRLEVGTTVNTADTETEKKFNAFVEKVEPQMRKAEQALKERLLASGLEPANFAIPLKKMRTEAALFRESNLPLFVETQQLDLEYNKLVGAQTVQWEGEERTPAQLFPVYLEPDRARREAAFRLILERRTQDRPALDALWVRYMGLRKQIAANAGFANYRDYRWQEMHRYDYNYATAETFWRAIEEVCVPAVARIHQKRRAQLGVDSLRPWDLYVDPLNRTPLKPFSTAEEFEAKTQAIFEQVDPVLGGHFATMRREKLLDLENRKNKAPGGYCTVFPAVYRPFIFMNAVGMQSDVDTLLHEGGHAFHVFETKDLPYAQQRFPGFEFAEVASMSMELLAAPYLTAEKGGFYSEKDAARARIEHLEGNISFLPYMAVVDAFQHWVYTHHDEATDPAACDAHWRHLWSRFMVGVDYSGLEDFILNRWRYQGHIFQAPFYYIDYGLAQVGAMQVWRNALRDQAEAVRKYRAALSLGDTRTLPELFNAAGAAFAFDTDTLRELIDLTENTIHELEAAEC